MTSTRIDYDLEVPMRDGTVLRADVHRPVGEGPWPVLLTRTPYGKGDSAELGFLEPWIAAKRGFITVVQDVRGRFASDGDWVPFVHEADDGADTVEWAARLPGSNGRVAMWGLSYLGTTQWLAASASPVALRAIAPRFTLCDPEDGLVARGGAGELGLGLSWSMYTGIEVLTRRFADDEPALGGALQALVDDFDALGARVYAELPSATPPALARHGLHRVGDLLADGSTDVSRADLTDRHATITVPSLNIGGWYDIFLQGTIDNYVAASRRTPSRLLIGPWSHVSIDGRQGDTDFGMRAHGAAIDLHTSITDLTLDFLHERCSDTTPLDDQTPVTVFVMGANDWRDLPAWPPADAVETPWFLGPDGGLHTERPSVRASARWVSDPNDPVPTLGGAIYLPDRAAGPWDQGSVESRADVVTFTGPVLTEDVEVMGRVRAVLTVGCDAPTADWVVRLCDVDESGVSRNITDGILRCAAPAEEEHQVVVDMWSTAVRFRVGHRVRLQVTSSCFPRWDVNTHIGPAPEHATESRTAQQRVVLGDSTASYVLLPVIPIPG
jgi:putative CocE/NonD family hydrolase